MKEKIIKINAIFTAHYPCRVMVNINGDNAHVMYKDFVHLKSFSRLFLDTIIDRNLSGFIDHLVYEVFEKYSMPAPPEGSGWVCERELGIGGKVTIDVINEALSESGCTEQLPTVEDIDSKPKPLIVTIQEISGVSFFVNFYAYPKIPLGYTLIES